MARASVKMMVDSKISSTFICSMLFEIKLFTPCQNKNAQIIKSDAQKSA